MISETENIDDGTETEQKNAKEHTRMGLSVEQNSFNLVDEKWIPVLYANGRFERVGIRQTLHDAGKIRQIAAGNPMDRVSLLRFLMAVLMWCKKDVKPSIQMLDMQNSGIPKDWLNKLKEHQAAFNLLGDRQRFYQDAAVKRNTPRPIADLLVEYPGADSVNHMRHVIHDGSYGFCPACCMLGILRLSVWAPANRFYPASINPSSATYAITEGKSLLLTLGANLPDANPQTDQAPWLDNEHPDSPTVVDRLAWRPRKLWLNVGTKEMDCAYCGSTGVLITSLCNEGGWPTPTTDSQEFSKAVQTEFKKLGYSLKGKDPANKTAINVFKAACVIRNCRMETLRAACGQGRPENQPTHLSETDKETTEREIARLFHELISKNDEKSIKALTKKANEIEQQTLGDGGMQKKFWGDDPQLLKDREPISLPDLGKDVAAHSSKFWRSASRLRSRQSGTILAIGPAVNKFSFQDAIAVVLPNGSDAAHNKVVFTNDCATELGGLLKQITPNPKREHPEIVAAFTSLTPNTEAQIGSRTRQSDSVTEGRDSDDTVFLLDIYAPMVEQVVASTTPGSPLRRLDTRHHAQALLHKIINKLTEKPNPTGESSDVPPPVQPQRGRRKGDSK